MFMDILEIPYEYQQRSWSSPFKGQLELKGQIKKNCNQIEHGL